MENNSVVMPGKELPVEFKFYSENKKCYLVFQGDGNLVLYSLGENSGAIWHSNTAGGDKYCLMQEDGNLVIKWDWDRDRDRDRDRDIDDTVWSSNTAGNPNSRLKVLGIGKVAIFRPMSQSSQESGPVILEPIWYTGKGEESIMCSLDRTAVTDTAEYYALLPG